jgi:superoxide reductase
MEEINNYFQKADWKVEKHVPVISVPNAVPSDELVKLTVSVGKEIPHPNTTEHHIGWIEVYFLPSQGKFPFSIGRFGGLCDQDPSPRDRAGHLFLQHSWIVD